MEEARDVPEDIRFAVLGDLLSAAKRGEMSYEDFILQCGTMIGHITAGHVTPEHAKAAQGWAELQFTALVAKQARDDALEKKTEEAKSSLASQIAAARERARKMRPQLTIDVDEATTFVEHPKPVGVER
jgi:hypothetical protein